MMFLAALLIYIITMMISYPDKYQCVMLEKYLKIYLSQFGINLLLSSLNGGLWASVGAVISLCFKEKFSGYFGAFAFFYILAGLQERYYMGWQYLNPINWISPVHTSWEILIILLLSLIVFMLVTLAFSIRRKLTR